jgi:hypothetical protein
MNNYSSLEEALIDGGFELKLAKNGAEGLATLERCEDASRGLITDIDLGKAQTDWTLRVTRAT